MMWHNTLHNFIGSIIQTWQVDDSLNNHINKEQMTEMLVQMVYNLKI